MREQPSAGFGVRPVLPGGKRDIAADRIGARVDGLRRCRALAVGMHAHIAEIGAEARLHEAARRRIERPAGRAQHLMHDRRRGGGAARIGGAPL